MSTAAVVANKKALRTSLRKTLKTLSLGEIGFQSTEVFSRVISHPAYHKARTVSCYLSMPSGELDTTYLVRSILTEGKVLFAPRIDHDRGEIDMLRIYDEQDINSLPSGTWGIKEPGLDYHGHRRENVMDLDSPMLDLVLLPGLAFDRKLSRLGHGKGYYDRFLTSYQSRIVERLSMDIHSTKMPVLLGLCLNQQLLHPSRDIPTTAHDWKVDVLVHPEGSMGTPGIVS